jgi:hypothetical protein
MTIIENFSLDKIKNLSQNEAKSYLIKYFIPLTDGNHAFYHNGKFEILDTKVVKSTYFNRMSKELNEYYFKLYTSLKTITYQLNEDVFLGDKLNLCPKMKAQKNKSYSEYDVETKLGVEAMLNFIKEVLASDNQASYDYLIKMPMISVSVEQVEKLQKEHANTLAELTELRNTTEEQMWLRELSTFETQYQLYVSKRAQEYVSVSNTSTGTSSTKKKSAGKK